MCSFFKPKSPVLPTVNVVAHSLSMADATAMRALGVTGVLLSWYGDNAVLTPMLMAAQSAQLTPVVVAEVPLTSDFVTLVRTNRGLILDGNEPEDPVAAARQFAVDRTTYGPTVLPPGLKSATPVATWQAALAAGLGNAGLLCAHAYGTPESDAVAGTIRDVKAAGWTGQLWLTEVGVPVGSNQATDLKAALLATGSASAVYVYAWVSDADQYTLTPDSRTMIGALNHGTA